MGRIFVLLFILVFLSASNMVVSPIKAEPETIVVPDDYATIQEALDSADAGDTIFVKKGVYVENPEIHSPVTLIGEDRDATVIDVTAGLKVESDRVTLTGFTIYDGWRGVSLSGNHCVISGKR